MASFGAVSDDTAAGTAPDSHRVPYSVRGNAAEHHNLAQKYGDSRKYPIFVFPIDGVNRNQYIIVLKWIKSVTRWA